MNQVFVPYVGINKNMVQTTFAIAFVILFEKKYIETKNKHNNSSRSTRSISSEHAAKELKTVKMLLFAVDRILIARNQSRSQHFAYIRPK